MYQLIIVLLLPNAMKNREIEEQVIWRCYLLAELILAEKKIVCSHVAVVIPRVTDYV